MTSRRRDDGFTLIELLIVLAIIGIIAAIAVPGLMRARISGNEASAIGSLRAISSAQSTYSSSCGGGGYAPSLVALNTPPTGSTVRFIPDDLGAGMKAGYVFTMMEDGDDVEPATDTCNGQGPSTTRFVATANPSTPGSTGIRRFGVDQSGLIRFRSDNTAVTDRASYEAGQVLQ